MIEVKEKFGDDYLRKIKIAAAKHASNFSILIDDKKIILTREGKLFADGIAADLFF